MGVRVEVGDGEHIGKAVRRFLNLVRQFGPPGAGGPSPKWHKRPHGYYLKPSQLARRVRRRKAWLSYLAECARRGLEPLSRHGVKQWEGRFGDAPLLDVFPDPLLPHLHEWCE